MSWLQNGDLEVLLKLVLKDENRRCVILAKGIITASGYWPSFICTLEPVLELPEGLVKRQRAGSYSQSV